jgi:hypothetical protein
MEAGYTSTRGVKAGERAERLLDRALELSTRTGDARALGLTRVMMAGCAWNVGQWEACYERARAAREVLRERHDFATWERDTAVIFEMDALRWLGRWSVMKSLLPALIEDARQRGDLYAEAILQMHGGSCAALADDQPGEALTGLETLQRWSNTGFHVEHLIELHNRVEIALYMGDAARAFALMTDRWQELRRSFLLRVQAFNIQMHSLRARAALAAAASDTPPLPRNVLLQSASRDRRVIESQGAVWGTVLAALLTGGDEILRGRQDEAAAAFARAEDLARGEGMRLHEASARRSHGLVIGGEKGRQLVALAEADFAAEGITNCRRLAMIVTPGLNSLETES